MEDGACKICGGGSNENPFGLLTGALLLRGCRGNSICTGNCLYLVCGLSSPLPVLSAEAKGLWLENVPISVNPLGCCVDCGGW